MSEQQVAEQLKKLIAQYGKQLVVEEPRRTAALLRDLFAQHKREARVLIAVVEEGLTAELVRDAGKTSAGILLPRQAKSLHDELGIDEKLALWAVRAWAEALGWSLPAPKVATAAKSVAAPKPPTSTPTKAPAQQKTLPLIGGRYLDNDDGTVTDSQTGLQWMRCSLGQEWDGKTCVGAAQGFTWQKAQNAANELNCKGGYAGYQEWRVPTIEELKSLIMKTNRPAICNDAFINTPPSWFWSSSPDQFDENNGWRTHFDSGHVNDRIGSYICNVRLVRSGQLQPEQATGAKPTAAPKPPISTPIKAPAQKKTQPHIWQAGRYLINGDGTVTDTQTDLQWMRCSLGQELDGKTTVGATQGFSWSGAFHAADELNEKGGYAGLQDWRLPTIDELKSLVLDENGPPYGFPAFLDARNDWFWSSTSDTISSFAWYVNFFNGHASRSSKDENLRVRLVRARQ